MSLAVTSVKTINMKIDGMVEMTMKEDKEKT